MCSVKTLLSGISWGLFAVGGLYHPIPNFLAAETRHRGGENHGFSPESIRDNARLNGSPVIAKFVSFGRNDQAWNLQIVNPLCQLEIKVRRRKPRVHQLDYADYDGAVSKIPFRQALPMPARSFFCLGVPKSRQVDKVVSAIKPEEVKAPCLTRRVAGPGKISFPRQPVDQAGLTYVGPACKYYFWNPITWEIKLRKGADDEFGLGHRRCIMRVSELLVRYVLVRTAALKV